MTHTVCFTCSVVGVRSVAQRGRGWPAAVIAVVAVVLGAPAVAPGAVVSVAPGLPAPGERITVAAAGLPPGAAGIARLTGVRERAFRVSAAGQATVKLRVPRAARSGARRLIVRAGGSRIATTLNVGARSGAPSTLAADSGGLRVVLTPMQGRVGDELEASDHRLSAASGDHCPARRHRACQHPRGVGRAGAAAGRGAGDRARQVRGHGRRRAKQDRAALRIAARVRVAAGRGDAPASCGAARRAAAAARGSACAAASAACGSTCPAASAAGAPPAPPPPPPVAPPAPPPPPPPPRRRHRRLRRCSSAPATSRPATHGRRGDRRAARRHPRDRLHPGRQRLQRRHAVAVRALLRAAWGRHKSRTRPAVGNHEYDGTATRATSTTSARPPGRPARATTATTSARGTSSCSTATARSSAAVMPGRRRSSGCAPTSPRTRRAARSRSGTTRASAAGDARQRHRGAAVLAGAVRGRCRARPAPATSTPTSATR